MLPPARSADAAHRSAAALEKMAEQWGEFMSRQEKQDQRQWMRPSSGKVPGWETRGGPWAGPLPGEPAEPVVHWTVDKLEGRRHQLKNLGRATAYAVELTCENAVRFNAPESDDIQFDESLASELIRRSSPHAGGQPLLHLDRMMIPLLPPML